MEVDSLKDYLLENREKLLQSIRDGKYRPSPVRRVEIPKEKGKKRLLGIPTVVDRVVQQAITQVFSPIYEQQFSPHSYGRPGKNTHQALRKCRDYITDGYFYAVDMDLQQFFETVNHLSYITRIKFLGYTFYHLKGKGRLRVHPFKHLKDEAAIKGADVKKQWVGKCEKKGIADFFTGFWGEKAVHFELDMREEF